MIEIIVDSERLDTYPNEVIGITFQSADVASFVERKLTTTNQFKIPATETNRRVLGSPEVISIQNSKIYSKTNANLVQDGRELINNGLLEIINASNEYYTIKVTSGVRSFFNAIKGKSLRDLDLSAYDHTQDFATILASYSNTDGYIYPVQDLFQNSPNDLIGVNTPFRVDYSFPWMYLKTLVDEIFTQAGFAYNAPDLIADQRYDKLLVSPDVSDENSLTSDRIRSNGQVTQRQASTPDPDAPDDRYYNSLTFDVINQGFLPVLSNDTYSVGATPITISTGRFTAPYDGTYNVRFKLNIFNDPADPDANTVLFSYQFNSTGTAGTIYDSGVSVLPTTGVIQYTEQVVTVEMKRGDELYLQMQHIVGTVSIDVGSYIAIDSVTVQRTYGSLWIVEDKVPDIGQTDFLLDIAKLFGLVFEQQPYTNVINIRFFSELFDNKSIAPDWSDKIQPNTEEIGFTTGDYAQLNEFKWKKDSNNTNEDLGNSAFSIDNENLQAVKTIFTLNFAASEERTNQTSMVNIPVYERQEDGTYQADGSYEPRLVMLGSLSQTLEVTDGDDTDTITTIPYTYFFEGDNPIGWNLFLSNYSGLVTALRDTRAMTCKMVLNGNDVIDKDLLTPVYIRKHGAFFFVNKITDWRKDKLVDVELIKV